MQRYNKAFQGGIGASVALIGSWALTYFGAVEVPVAVQSAAAIVLAGLFPVFGPANKE